MKRADLSVLRILSTLSVILMHSCSAVLDPIVRGVDGAVLIETLSRSQALFFIFTADMMTFAVPVFLMITGALQLNNDDEINIKRSLKYSLRVLLALFIFGLPYSCLESVYLRGSFSPMTLKYAVKDLITGNSWGHLWYLYAVFGMYLILPLIKKWIRHGTKQEQEYILLVLFIFNMIIAGFKLKSGQDIAFNLPISGFTFFYVLIGAYLFEYSPKIFSSKLINLLAILIVAVARGAYAFYVYPAGISRLDYSSPLTAILAVLIFSLFKNVKAEMNGSLWRLDRLCFAVYLVHPLFINFAYKYLKLSPVHFGKAAILSLLVFFLIFSVLSFFASWVLNRITVLKKYVL